MRERNKRTVALSKRNTILLPCDNRSWVKVRHANLVRRRVKHCLVMDSFNLCFDFNRQQKRRIDIKGTTFNSAPRTLGWPGAQTWCSVPSKSGWMSTA